MKQRNLLPMSQLQLLQALPAQSHNLITGILGRQRQERVFVRRCEDIVRVVAMVGVCSEI